MSEIEPHPSHAVALSRRRLLRAGFSAAAALPLGFAATTGRAWGLGPGAPFDPGPLCVPAAAEGAAGPLRPIKLAWNATAICTAAAPVAKELALYGDELKRVNVLRRTTDTAKFAERVYADVLS